MLDKSEYWEDCGDCKDGSGVGGSHRRITIQIEH